MLRDRQAMSTIPPSPLSTTLTRGEVQAALERWEHPRRDAWLAA